MDSAAPQAEANLLLERYSDLVLRIAMHSAREPADAEDIAQEVFLKRVATRRVFSSPEHEKAWMIRVTINQCRDYLKSARRRGTVPLDRDIPGPARDTRVLDAVRELPEPYRNAVYLYYYEGYTIKEIARILRRRENTVSSWLHRARAMLKKSLTGGFDNE